MLPLALLLAIRLVPDAAGVEYRQPQLAVAGNVVALTFGAGNSVYFSQSRDNGRSFSRPSKVAEAGALALGRHRGPRINIAGGAMLISAVAGKRGRGDDGDLTAWRSIDGGKSWSPGVIVNDAPAAAREGLHAMAAGPHGLVFAAWLDLRKGRTELYGARSTDGGATWSKNVLIYKSPDGHICECCHPSALIDAKEHIYVMWRNWMNGARDMYLARSDDRGETFQKAQKLGVGTWPLNACPMDGGGLAVDARQEVVSVWRRGDAVYLAGLATKEIELGKGKDPAAAVGPDGIYAAWTTPAGLRARVPGKPNAVVLSEDGSYAHLASGNPVVAAWESKGAIVIQALR